MKDLNEVRETLIEMLEDLDDRLDTIINDKKQKAESDTRGFAGEAVGAEGDEVMELIGHTIRQDMEQIKQTLSRIDDGTYGICLCCGQALKKADLKVNIFSRLCVHCSHASGKK